MIAKNKFEIVDEMRIKYTILELCNICNVSRSGYYKWKIPKKENPKKQENEILENLILEAHEKYRGIYGKWRLLLYIKSKVKFIVNHKRVHRLMKKLKIKSVIRKKRINRKYLQGKVAPNVLKRDFATTVPLQKLCMDVTYIELSNNSKSRFIYMNAVKDLSNGELVAYDLSLKNDSALVDATINKLLTLPLAKDCILHTDQGVLYTAIDYSKKLKDNGIVQSMSRRGNCWDNAPIESFFSHFKTESLYITKSKNYDDIIEEISNYANFYNYDRPQKKLNGLSPVQYRIQTT